MSSGCGDVLSLEDLKTAKKHQTFEAEVITGKAGGIASGADIDYATNQVTGQVQKTLPAILSDLGYRVASFTFITGGTLSVGDTDVAVLWPVSSGGDGNYYRWKGSYPKFVPANSTPSSSGGISDSGWMPVGDITLRGDLASSDTGKGVSLVYGAAKQSDVTALQDNVNSIAYIENYSSLVVDGDWSDAIQAALDTGKDVYGVKGKAYMVSKVLNSKGQKLLGDFKINIIRYSLGETKANSIVTVSADVKIKMCYVSAAYDLSEMLYIKSLGFNVVHHYLGFSGSVDSAGNTAKLLNNALSAGLKVSLGTEQDPLAISDLRAFIASVDSHPAVIMYAVYDEPGARGISVADQDAKISVLRGVTSKTLQMVCQLPPGGPFTQWYSTNYDLAFVDSYSTATNGTLQQRIDQDLNKMRLDFGVIQQMTGVKRTIPCIGTFLFSGSNISGDIDQVVGGCKVFGTAGNGEFAAFVWDGEADPGITSRLRTNAVLRKVVKDLSDKVYYKSLETKTYLFGGNGTSTFWPLDGLLKDIIPVDAYSNNPSRTKNAWPTMVTTGTSDSDHATTQANSKASGIAWKTADAILCLTQKYSAGASGWLEASNLNGGTAFGGNFYLSTTVDGYTLRDIVSNPISATSVFRFGFAPQTYSAKGEMVALHFSFPAGTSSFYRSFLRGAMVFSDW